jgi:UDP-N-acetylmuramate dehydrogenase
LPEDWLALYPGMRQDEPLAPHSWYGIGGRAQYFLELDDDRDLANLVARLRGERLPTTVIGAATNTLFAADELPGLTIKLTTRRLHIDGDTIAVSAGYLMPKLAAEASKAGGGGLEFAAGVPGSVGGSVFGNAGAFGGEVKDRLIDVEALDEQGHRVIVPVAECAFAYRDSIFKRTRQRWTILSARFRTSPEAPAAVRSRLLQVQKHRRATQPIEQRSLGSTFKNPPGDSAGRLIDAAGLKGLRIGGAQISAKHANFIVNLGGASADDVLALMAEMRQRVFERFGIELEPEIRVIGRAEAG